MWPSAGWGGKVAQSTLSLETAKGDPQGDPENMEPSASSHSGLAHRAPDKLAAHDSHVSEGKVEGSTSNKGMAVGASRDPAASPGGGLACWLGGRRQGLVHSLGPQPCRMDPTPYFETRYFHFPFSTLN